MSNISLVVPGQSVRTGAFGCQGTIMESYQRAFGQYIRQLRNQRDYRQERLALECGIHATYLSGIERGIRNPSLKIIRALARGLGVAVSELFD